MVIKRRARTVEEAISSYPLFQWQIEVSTFPNNYCRLVLLQIKRRETRQNIEDLVGAVASNTTHISKS